MEMQRENIIRDLLLVLFFVGVSGLCIGQKVISIEKRNVVKPIKYFEGDQLIYKIIDHQNWQKGVIRSIDVNQNIIAIDDHLVSIDSISHIRRNRSFAKYLGRSLVSFGGSWLVYGLLASAGGHYDLDTDTFVVSGSSIALGLLFEKIFYKRTIAIGKRYRIRLLDIGVY